MFAIKDLPEELKQNLVMSAIDITGQTMMANRERLAVLLLDRRPALNEAMAIRAVDFALEVLAMLAADAEENVG
jgi:hypothetical protein